MIETKKIAFSQFGEQLEEPIIAKMLTRALERPEYVSLAAGFTDSAMLPKSLIQEALSALSNEKGLPVFLQYGSIQGRPELREKIIEFLIRYPGEKNTYFSSENTIISNGSQQTLYLSMQVLCDPGDIVLVEGPSYFVFLELLKGLGIKAVSMPMSPDGCIDLPALDQWLQSMKEKNLLHKIKSVYLVSYYSNPSSHSMPLENKVGLASLLKKWDLLLPVMEDAAYRELYFTKPFPAPSVLSLEEYEDFPCLYLGTFSKPFSTGMKVGYGICTHDDWIEKMLYVKGHHDFGTANFNQALIEYILKKDLYENWLEPLHAHYKAKSDHFEEIAEAEGFRGLGWSWEKMQGGLLAWVKGPENLDTGLDSKFNQACLDNGVFYIPGDICFAEREPKNYVRLSIGTPSLDKLTEGLKRFIKIARQFT